MPKNRTNFSKETGKKAIRILENKSTRTKVNNYNKSKEKINKLENESLNLLGKGFSNYSRLISLFNKAEKIFQKEYGVRCPDFEPLCVQCSFWQDFNNFKRETFRRNFE